LRRTLLAAAIIAAVALVAGGAVLWLFREPLPRTRGSLSAKGLDGTVEVLRDRYGVPHIRAGTMHDLLFAQGYVTAQDRFWQMEFWRRIGSGRLSELFGKATLGTDMYLRTVGFRRVAEQEYAEMNPGDKAVLDAYAEGVNAYIMGRPARKLGLEFSLLALQGVKVTIEPWTPVNSITWLKLMAEDLGGNMRKELYTIDLLHALGASLTRDFMGGYRFGEHPVIVEDNEMPPALLKAKGEPSLLAPRRLAALSGVPTRLVGGFDPGKSLAIGTGPGIGSNNWVIGGSLTASGKPILANDPHLGIQMPSIWYEIELSCPAGAEGAAAGRAFHVRGFSFAGTPGVVIGHNERIAWGVTNVGPDVQDLYVERINPENPAQYEADGRWVDMRVIREEIRVRGEDEPVLLTVRQTRHGPIITDDGGFAGYRGFSLTPHAPFPAAIELKALSLRWTALQKSNTFRSVLLLDQAANFTEFRDALRSWDIPSQNFVYADVDGNIGYQCPGLIPIRRGGDGSVPAPGWTDEHEWTGFVPFDELPSSYNPAKGYIVTANNPVTSERYRHFLSGDFDHGYRAARITEMIEAAGRKITPRDVMAMQGDILNISAREVIPFLAGLTLTDPGAAAARGVLQKWDLRMAAESAGAAVYSRFWVSLVEAIFKDKIPRSLWNPETAFDDNSRLMDVVLRLLKEPRHVFWDDRRTPDKRETRDDILVSALAAAARKGTKVQGKDLTRWRWGRDHTAVFRNQTLGKSGIGLVERMFNRGPVPVGGGFQQVFCTDWKFGEAFRVRSVSSLRHLVDLSDLASSLAMNTTGQSGHPGSRHYADMIGSWSTVRYHPTFWDRSALDSSGPDLLVLKPAAPAGLSK
jgi:penicillin G amidase